MKSPGNSRTCDEKVRIRVDYMLDNYAETKKLYEKLVKLTRKECEKLLENIYGKDNKKGIKGVVQGRTKKYESLKEKLDGLKDLEEDPKEYRKKKLTELENDHNKAPNFRDWVSDDENDIYEHPEMGDLAGVRIGLYFPDDVLRVAQKIEEHFDRKWLFGTVTGGRNAIKGRNMDIEKHMDGRWCSQGPDGTVEYWEHYGYKSWQAVVEWKKPLPEHLKSLRVEIQVGTVVTQAWAEVQHNIIYKKSTGILSTPSMKRMIDGINGLAITTDIMLRELEQSLELAKEEAKQRGKKEFRNGKDILDWFHSTYMSRMPPKKAQRWKSSHQSQADGLCKQVLAFERRLCCPDEFKKLIEENKLLPETATIQDLDIFQRLQRINIYDGGRKRRVISVKTSVRAKSSKT